MSLIGKGYKHEHITQLNTFDSVETFVLLDPVIHWADSKAEPRCGQQHQALLAWRPRLHRQAHF